MNKKFFELSEDKRLRIINAAAACFAESGYRKTSMQDIAEKAGISKLLLIQYFKTKRDLYRYAFEYCYNLLANRLGRFDYRDDEDVFDMIRRSESVTLELCRAYPVIFRFIYRTHFESGSREIAKNMTRDYVTRSEQQIAAHLDKNRLRDGVSQEQAMRMVLWVIFGFLKKRMEQGVDDPETLKIDLSIWLDILKTCLYKD